jgi:SAM-dependent methyltransferase
VYRELLKRLAEGQLLVDIGCFIGHDLRHLVHDGAPSENLHGIDIADFWDLGFEMYNDRGRFNAHFTKADFLSSDGAMAEFRDKCDIISIFQVRVEFDVRNCRAPTLTSSSLYKVLHQWNWKGQVEACKALVSFSKPNSVVVGNQIGNTTGQEISLKSLPIALWRHDVGSFARLWEEVGLATNTVWESSSWIRTFEEMDWKPEDAGWMEEGVRVLEFTVRRVS